MANNLVIAEANRLLNASLGSAAYVAPTGPMKLALTTTTGTNAAAGTEVAGGSYARQTIAFALSTAASASNSGIVTFTALPACTITAVEIYDSAGRRAWTGPLSATRTVLAGDSLSFAVASLVATLT